MHSLTSRLMALMSLTFTSLAIAAVAVGVVSYITEGYVSPSRPTGAMVIRPNKVFEAEIAHPMKPDARRSVQRSVVELGIQADFSPCFNWNTKQVYVFIVATYETADRPRNVVTLWDKILTSKEEARFTTETQWRNERRGWTRDYLLDDHDMGLKGANVTVRLMYNTMYYSGSTFVREIESAANSYIAQ